MNAPVAHRALLGAALTAALFAAGINVAQSQNEPTPAYPAVEKHKPTTLADRIVLTHEADPSNSQSVTWRTDTTVKTAQAQIAVAEEGPYFDSKATTVLATRNIQQKSDLGSEAVFHTVRFTGLTPETKYLYRVGDGTNWSEWLEFETAAATAKPFSFVYFGDAQNDVQEHWSRVIRQAFADAPEAKLTVHAGDLIDVADNDAQWGEWFKAGSFIHGMRNNIATPGNHEYRSGVLAPVWRTQFAFPDNGPKQGTQAVIDALKDTAYYTDYQGVRFISLNSNTSAVASALRPEFLEVQRAWLESVLQNNPNKWTVATFHHPMFSTAEGRNNPAQRASWLPVFERYGVDLVLQGHDHSYGRGNVVEGTTANTGKTIYVVSVSGPKMYEANDSNWVNNGAVARKILEQTQLYQVISIDGDKLSYKSKTATGRLYDDFTITKPAQGPKVITENLESEKPAGVGGTVQNTLALSVEGTPTLGSFTPGVAEDYETSFPVKVTSTAADATLSIVDPSTNAPGKLVNGTFSLAQPLQAAVNNPFAAISGNPLVLHTWAGPVSNDQLSLKVKQTIGETEALRTGSYAKPLTLTLSTTNP
ncbi:metallophosphoesterase family protein [Solirubrobacter sp. CPCC 204708]|uniref:Metallophosphoesterase family protein n=1 Tax=Solirubrobacter deserti TaxID=2282478 RepID=A0ABT4RUB5_9ACTN|nr:metallophosphoesterase family protein [Solirubrobacter deserti]MBE2316342.1 metallophosphoesterase family protein [Solirubrobacter deserti]MDA0142126.1 metallophosphoesterase family protein [Solirubrobacter deserti]